MYKNDTFLNHKQQQKQKQPETSINPLLSEILVLPEVSVLDHVNQSFRRLSLLASSNNTGSAQDDARDKKDFKKCGSFTDVTVERIRREVRTLLYVFQSWMVAISQSSCTCICANGRCIPSFLTSFLDFLSFRRLLCIQKQSPLVKSRAQATSEALKNQEKTAALLEEELFRASPTLQDYSNTKTLEIRLRIVLQRLRAKQADRASRRQRQARARQRVQSVEKDTYVMNGARTLSSSRSRLLLQLLGEDHDRYAKVQELVESIRYERQRLVGSSCPKCKNKAQFQLIGQEQRLSPAVKALFFRTPLVEIWQDYSTERLQGLARNCSDVNSQCNWQQLVEQAQEHLSKYLEWKAQNTVCER